MAQHHPTKDVITFDLEPWYHAVLFIMGLVGIVAFLRHNTALGFLCVALLGLAATGFKETKNNPRHIRLNTLLGQYTNKVRGPGWTFLPPLLMGTIDINCGKKINDFLFPGIACRLKETNKKSVEEAKLDAPKSGGAVMAKVSFIWEPDDGNAERVISYVNSGIPEEAKGSQPKGGIVEMVQSKLAEIFRLAGAYLDWEAMKFGTERLSAMILGHLTGEWPKKFRRNADAFALKADGTILPNQLDRNQFVEVGNYTFDDLLKAENSLELRLDLHFYFKDASEGYNDIHDLGVKILRLNVEEVKPEGKLEKDSEAAALEEQQARKQMAEQLGRIAAVEALFNSAKKLGDTSMTMEKAMGILRIDEGKAKETFHRFAIEGDPKEWAELFRELGPVIRAVAPQLNTKGGEKS